MEAFMLCVGTVQFWSAATRRRFLKAQTCLRTPYQKPRSRTEGVSHTLRFIEAI